MGFATIAFLVIKIFRRDIKLNNSFFDILLFLAIIINGTIFAFFSWAPFWVTLGYMIGDVNFTKYPPKKWS